MVRDLRDLRGVGLGLALMASLADCAPTPRRRPCERPVVWRDSACLPPPCVRCSAVEEDGP